jgi:homoserine O-acetyltransferase
MLGSSYGSTNAASTNPATGKRYGSTFPELTVVDIVRSQWVLLESLGVRHLAAVCGVSYGGLLAFQWGMQYPDRVDALVPVLCSPRAPPVAIDKIIASLAQSPHWQGGDYYEGPGMAGLLAPMRAATLQGYGIDAVLQRRFSTAEQRAIELQRLAAQWAQEFDANSLHILMRPLVNFDLTPHLRQIRARVLYVLSRSDQLFPPSLAAEVMPALQAAGVRADYFEIDSPCGHFASGVDAALWAPRLREFLQDGRH